MRKIALIIFAGLIALSCSKKVPLPVPFVAENVFAEANEKLKKKDYEEARKLFEDIKLKDTGNAYAPLAQLRIADSYVQEEEPEVAVDEFREFVRDYPMHRYASYAQYQIGLVYYNMIKGPDRGYGAAVRALDEFEALERLYPRHPYKETVKYKMDRARDVIADHEFLVGDFYFKKGAYRGAVDRLGGLLRDFPDYGRRAEALYRLAVSHWALGERGKAEHHLNALSVEHAGDELIQRAREKFRELNRKDEP
jgi:outer membrane protein assembly factor BamD